MKVFKMLLQMSAIAALTIGCFTTSYAHPGRTDSNGGHYNRSTGEYHYHHGYPEHQHPNGVCPYDFDDKTEDSSRTSGYRSSSTKIEPLNDSSLRQDFNALKQEHSNLQSRQRYLLIALTGASFILFFVIRELYILSKKNAELTQKIKLENKEHFLLEIANLKEKEVELTVRNEMLSKRIVYLEDKLKDTSNSYDSIELQNTQLNRAYLESEERADYLSEHVDQLQEQNEALKLYITQLVQKLTYQASQSHILKENLFLLEKSDLSPEECFIKAGVPTGVTFDEDLLPHYYVNPSVENNFYVYISLNGKCYHRKYMCSGAFVRVHLFTVADKYTPCERCVPSKAQNYKIPSWYYKYVALMKKHIIDSSSSQN